MENNSILNIINDLFSKLFSSIDNSIYGILDKITFITPEIIEGKNFKNIIEYKENSLLIQCKKYQLQIEGKNLYIEIYSKEEMKVKGIIYEIKFLGRKREES